VEFQNLQIIKKNVLVSTKRIPCHLVFWNALPHKPFPLNFCKKSWGWFSTISVPGVTLRNHVGHRAVFESDHIYASFIKHLANKAHALAVVCPTCAVCLSFVNWTALFISYFSANVTWPKKCFICLICYFSS